MRDKEETKQKIINAVGKIIEKDGFDKIGINAIAKKAGVDKVLIYRYFGGLDNLLNEYVMQEDLVKRLIEEFKAVDIVGKESFIKSTTDFYIKELRDLRANKKYQEILLWELLEKNSITIKIAEIREQLSTELFEKLNCAIKNTNIDIPSLNNILIGGIIYQVLRSRHVDQFAGLKYNHESGWQRLEDTIHLLIKTIAEVIFKN
ncbi:MAG: TetR/AcrR family transcriptional regulator [Candidatus Marinimicrobia bacterium]|nr:TetR/AcrR family transcriptional regulator [Candidatus Neomarinimicrobiota bacterium]